MVQPDNTPITGLSVLDSDETTAEVSAGRSQHVPLRPVLQLLHPVPALHELTTSITIGRATACDLVLPGKRASRVHCRLVVDGDLVKVVDAQSRNGTFVNGVAVHEAELCVGDVVRIGDWVGIFDRRSRATPQRSWTTSGSDAMGMVVGAELGATLERVEAIARTSLPLAICGQSGSGKEVVAKFLHDASGRTGPFLAINCAAIPEHLAESELFGHQRGAFTGAARNHLGALRRAHQGTLLLDEVGDLSLAVQAKLLRALEDKHITAVGADQATAVDLRIVVAGQQPLAELVAAGRFRGDLYARLNGLEVALAPLCERRDEILELFLRCYSRYLDGVRPRLSGEFAEMLLLQPWPYNVRELLLTAQRLAALHGERYLLDVRHAPASWISFEQRGETDSEPPELGPVKLHSVPQLRESRRLQQLAKLHRAIDVHGGNVTRAAESLGISRGRAYRLMESGRDKQQGD